MTFAWNDTNTQHLREMWAKGWSASRIAEALGNPSRNSVIGRASRIGLDGRQSPIIRGHVAAVRKPYCRRPKPENPEATETRAKAKLSAEERKRVREAEIAERARQAEIAAAQRREDERKRHERSLARAEASDRHRCAYPIGDPKKPDFRFCGEEIKPGSSYCPNHHALCWVTPPVLTKRAA